MTIFVSDQAIGFNSPPLAFPVPLPPITGFGWLGSQFPLVVAGFPVSSRCDRCESKVLWFLHRRANIFPDIEVELVKACSGLDVRSCRRWSTPTTDLISSQSR